MSGGEESKGEGGEGGMREGIASSSVVPIHCLEESLRLTTGT